MASQRGGFPRSVSGGRGFSDSHLLRGTSNLMGKNFTARIFMAAGANRIASAVLLSMLFVTASWADNKPFHDAPASARAQKNPFAGQQAAVDAGKALYVRNCLACHGKAGQGTGNVPSLVDGKLNGVSAGEVFWFITKGDKENGMPSWAALPEEKRWQVVTYVEAMASGKVMDSGKAGAGPTSAPQAEV